MADENDKDDKDKKDATGTSSPTAESSATGSTSTTIRRVRFPAGNNPNSGRSFFTNEEEGLEPLNNNNDSDDDEDEDENDDGEGMSPTQGAFTSTRYPPVSSNAYSRRNTTQTFNNSSTPPIQEEDGEPQDYFSIPMRQQRNAEGSPALYVTRPDESQTELNSRRSSASSRSSMSTHAFDSSRNLLRPMNMNQPAIINNDMAGALDVGIYTSAGLAPGARSRPTEDDPDDDLERRRQSLLRSLESEHTTPTGSPTLDPKDCTDEIPLHDLNEKPPPRAEEDPDQIAKRLVRSHTLRKMQERERKGLDEARYGEQFVHPEGFQAPQHEDYVPPGEVKQGVLASLLKLYSEQENQEREQRARNFSAATSPGESPMMSRRSSFGDVSDSGATTPTYTGGEGGKKVKWYKHKRGTSSHSLSSMVRNVNRAVAAPAEATATGAEKLKKARPRFPRSNTAKKQDPEYLVKKRAKQEAKAQRNKITVHIAGVLQRQRFILRICRALMMYGAPSHRLEEYLKMTSRVLEINSQYLYIPGCMIVSFDDAMTHTSEMRLIRCVQGLNLSKLHETHQIYKEVVHDVIGVDEASQRVDELLARPNRYPEWLCVLFFGLSSAFVTPWAFGGYWQDIPISFLLGGSVGVLQVVVAPRSDLYSNVFEVTSSIVVSFLGRAIGSIRHDGGTVFCFAAIAQGSLALILPGYIILCGSLELQSKNIVSGSVRMFYAIIYSLFLGFGITMGATIYGWMDGNATSKTSCDKKINPWFYMLFLPLFSVFIAQANQANIRQLPIMVFIACSGYAVTYFIRDRVSGSSDFVSAIGAFTIGVLGNLYSRIGHGLAFAAMLPALFAQVPNSLSSSQALIAGIQSADRIVSNGTKPLVSSLPNGEKVTHTPTPSPIGGSTANGNALNLGMAMVQVCIGITVGLFVATLVIYPFGKKRSGLFTF